MNTVQTVIYWEWVLNERCERWRKKQKQLKIEVDYLNRHNIIWCTPWFIECQLQCVYESVFMVERRKERIHSGSLFWARRFYTTQSFSNCQKNGAPTTNDCLTPNISRWIPFQLSQRTKSLQILLYHIDYQLQSNQI